MHAHASANTIVPNCVSRELVITVSLPDDKGRSGDGRPKVRRFRSHWRELGRRLVEFRARYGITQAEIAAVGAGHTSTVAQWESGAAVPEGARRERLVTLLEGRLWPQLRGMVVSEADLPRRWAEAVRWYRRASRERRARLGVGAAVAAVLQVLREVDSLDGLRERYRAEAGEWASRRAPDCKADALSAMDRRRAEEAAFGLRWLELACGHGFDPSRSLAGQLSPTLLAGALHETPSAPGAWAHGQDHPSGSDYPCRCAASALLLHGLAAAAGRGLIPAHACLGRLGHRHLAPAVGVRAPVDLAFSPGHRFSPPYLLCVGSIVRTRSARPVRCAPVRLS